MEDTVATYSFDFGALFMTCIAGLSTSIGGLFVLWAGAPTPDKLGTMLGFAAGVMIYISFMDLLAEAIESIGMLAANLSFFAGMVFFAFIARLVPEPELGEVAAAAQHKKDEDGKGRKDGLSEKELLKTALMTAVGVSVHNLPEGMCVYLACLEGISRGIPLIIAIAVHNIPEGMSVAAPVYHSTRSKWETMKWTTLSGLCEPVGAALFGTILMPILAPEVVKAMLAAVGGIMVYVCFVELLPTAFKSSRKEEVAIAVVMGMAVIFLTLWFAHDVLHVAV